MDYRQILADQRSELDNLELSALVSRIEEGQINLKSKLAQIVIGVRRSGKLPNHIFFARCPCFLISRLIVKEYGSIMQSMSHSSQIMSIHSAPPDMDGDLRMSLLLN